MTKHALQVIFCAASISIIALLAVWTRQPLLAPSLASAAYAQILTPESPSAKPWSNTVGQLCGLAAGFAGVFASGAFATPIFMGGHELVYARVLAVLIAAGVGGALQLALKATSPAGGATAIIVAIGAETANWAGAGRLLGGILLVTLLGETVRMLVLRAK